MVRNANISVNVPRNDSSRRDGRTRDTRERIHTVALELFLSQGFAKTTMQDIADQLALTKAALYYHFPTKRDLIRSVVQPAMADINDFLTEMRRLGAPRRELLERFFDINSPTARCSSRSRLIHPGWPRWTWTAGFRGWRRPSRSC